MSNKLPAVVQTAIQNQDIVLQDVQVILPTESYGQLLGTYDKVCIEVVKISTNPKDKEVYDEGKEKAFTKIGLEKFALAVGIQWDPVNTGITLSEKYKSIAKATGKMKKANGEWVYCTETKTIDCELYEEEQLEVVTEKAGKGNLAKIKEWKKTDKGKSYPIFEPWINEDEKQKGIIKELNRIVRQKRKFKDELAMTGAKNRVIRYFLAIKGTYRIDELQKPFAIPRIITDTSAMLEDPKLRQHALNQMTGASFDIFGGEKTEIKNVTPETKQLTHSNEADQEEKNDNDTPPPDPPPPPPNKTPLADKIIKAQRDELLELLESEHVSPKEKEAITAWMNTDDSKKKEYLNAAINKIKRAIDSRQEAEKNKPNQAELEIC